MTTQQSPPLPAVMLVDEAGNWVGFQDQHGVEHHLAKEPDLVGQAIAEIEAHRKINPRCPKGTLPLRVVDPKPDPNRQTVVSNHGPVQQRSVKPATS